MKAADLRDRTVRELEEQERDLVRELWKTRMDNYTSQLDDTAKIRRLRRDVARVKTILAESRAHESGADENRAPASSGGRQQPPGSPNGAEGMSHG